MKVPIESHLLKQFLFESKHMVLHFFNDSSEVIAGVRLLKPEIVQLIEAWQQHRQQKLVGFQSYHRRRHLRLKALDW